MIPSPWPALVLTLAAFRICRLIGWDDLPPIVRLRDRMTGMAIRYTPTESRDPIISYRRPLLAHFLACPYCLGFWISLAVYGVWLLEPTGVLYGAAPFALAAAVGIIARQLDP